MITSARRPAPTRTGRRLAALTLVGMVGLTGCQALSPLETMRDYAPATGELVRSGDVSVLDLHVVATEADSEGKVLGSVVNSGAEAQEVTLSADGSEIWSGTVEPHSSVKLADEKATLAKSAAPGAFQEVQVDAGGQKTTVRTPVALPTGHLEKYAPEGWEAPERPTKEDVEAEHGEHGGH